MIDAGEQDEHPASSKREEPSRTSSERGFVDPDEIEHKHFMRAMERLQKRREGSSTTTPSPPTGTSSGRK